MVNSIAVIDDDAMIRKSVTFLLADKFVVQGYASADQFLQRANDPEYQLPSLMLLDLMMPGTNGKKLLKFLKDNSRFKDLPVIILSAKNDAAEIQQLEEIGAAAYISKPFEFSELQKCIDSVLEGRIEDSK